MINIRPIEAFSDNYIWMIDNGSTAWLVDPGQAAPVLKCLDKLGLSLEGVLITHHHPDHVGGIDDLQASYPALKLIGPPSKDISHKRKEVSEPNNINILGVSFKVLSIPGHTLDHIAYTATVNGSPVLFCGDTLFAGGCGRLFEGSPAQMWQSLEKLAALPKESLVYCAHEYTLANLAFAAKVEPNNTALAERIKAEQKKRAENIPTVPSTIERELATNPFLRVRQTEVIDSALSRGISGSDTTSVFAAIRQWKDSA